MKKCSICKKQSNKLKTLILDKYYNICDECELKNDFLKQFFEVKKSFEGTIISTMMKLKTLIKTGK